ncbi:MAG: DUF2358 domain-containing protein [Moorea sp. SIO2B7]|nr:DUF2358 domain-containing protein [Moorena sp. SIO2B7]
MDIIEILKEDYQRFPFNQTYNIYSSNVYFKDPLNQFRGIERYKKMINFLSTFFNDIKMDLHEIQRTENIIKTEWTLHMTSPLPWKPRLSIPGRSELQLDQDELIISHIDYWNCSPFDVLKQNLYFGKL